MRRLATFGVIFGMGLGWLFLRPYFPSRATADERQVLALVLARELRNHGCVAPLTEPRLFGGTYGFAAYSKTADKLFLDRLDAWTNARDVRLMVDPGKFPDLFSAIGGSTCFGRSRLETPRIGRGVAFVNVRSRATGPAPSPQSGAYALIRYPQGWRIVDYKSFGDGPVS